MSLRTLHRRVANLEKASQPIRSPFVIWYGSFEAFADETYAEIRDGKLDQTEMLEIIEALRDWEVRGVWMMAYSAINPR
jgi:hypothetical protein